MRYTPVIELAAAVLAGFSSFVEVHIWSPSYTYFLLLLLVVLDSALRNKLQKRVPRPLHMLIILVAYTLVLAFAHGFGGHEIGLRWLPQVVLAPLVIFHLRRLIVNLSKLDLMDEDVATLLSVKIGKRAEEPAPPAPPVEEEEEEYGSACVVPPLPPVAVASLEPAA